MTYFLAIDIGASSGRHILGRIEDGILKTEEIYRFKNGATEKNGYLVWDTENLFREIIKGLKCAQRRGKVPSFVGIDTWAVDYTLLDEEDRLIGPVYCYRDDRTESVISAVHRIVPFERLYTRTGIQFQPFNTIYQLAADFKKGRLQGAKTFLMLPDYLHFLLTGVKKQEYTNATSTGLVNATTHEWDREVIEKLALPQTIFGELSQPGMTVGDFTKEVAEAVGFQATVILPATHDTASAVLAAPLDGQTPYLSSGTWSLLGVEQKVAHTDANSRLVNYSNEGSIDFTFRYQKNIMGLWMIQSLRRELGERYSFSELADMARCKEFNGIVDVNDKCFLAPMNMGEEIDKAIGRPLSTASRMRVIYDSLAHSYASAVKELEHNTGNTYDTLNIIGGGCRDEFLNRLTAQATGKRIITGPIEATAIGNIVMQMIGAGELKDIYSARKLIRESFEIKEII